MVKIKLGTETLNHLNDLVYICAFRGIDFKPYDAFDGLFYMYSLSKKAQTGEYLDKVDLEDWCLCHLTYQIDRELNYQVQKNKQIERLLK